VTSPLRVGIDATAAATPRPTGVGLAIAHLVRALRDLEPGADVDLEVLYRLSRARRRASFLPGSSRLYHERLSLLLARRLDVVHGPDARLPRFRGPALVATVHDLSARRPGFSSERFRRTREAHWARVRERASLVVTYTAAVRAEVAAGLGVDPARIAVVPLAPVPAAEVAPEDVDAVAGLTAGAPYVLYLGERSRRKNAAGAVAAFAAAGRALADHRLVLAGPAGRGAEETDATIARAGLGERVVVADYLPAGQVAALLDGAAALLFPSRYEGFGMPVLEAFRAGVPVVASRDESVVEVAAGAALHAEADDPDGLGAALATAVREPARRAELVAAGRARLEAFSWARSGRLLLDVYRAAAAGRPAPRPEELPCSP